MSCDRQVKVVSMADRVLIFSLYATAFCLPLSIAAVETFIFLAVLAFIVKKMLRPDFGFLRDRAHFFLLLFFVFSAFSLVNSGVNMHKSLNALFFKWGEYILLFFVVQDTLSDPRRIRNTVFVLLASAALVALDCASQYFFSWEFVRGKVVFAIDGTMKAITGPFKHYNSLAAYLVCTLTLILSILTVASGSFLKDALRGKKRQGGLILLGLVLACALLLTFSRGAWTGLTGALLLMLLLSRQLKLMVSQVVIFSFVLFNPVIRDRAFSIFHDGADTGRFGFWSAAAGMIHDHPWLGTGIGTFMSNFAQYGKVPGIWYAHNCYLQIWAETGIFALISFLAFLFLIFQRGFAAFGKTRDGVVLGLVCALFGYAVHAFFDNHLYSVQLAVLFWFMAGLVAAASRLALQEGKGAVDADRV
ncbi:MAG: O-antigen ligase family protein [Candidatus Omnitrophota bacterium]